MEKNTNKNEVVEATLVNETTAIVAPKEKFGKKMINFGKKHWKGFAAGVLVTVLGGMLLGRDKDDATTAIDADDPLEVELDEVVETQED